MIGQLRLRQLTLSLGGCALALSCVGVTSVKAQVDVVWDGSASSDWANPANWVSNAVPTDEDNARFNAGGAAVARISSDVGRNYETFIEGNHTLEVAPNGAVLVQSGIFVGGASGNGSVTQSGGVVRFTEIPTDVFAVNSRGLLLGAARDGTPQNSGTYALSGGLLTQDDSGANGNTNWNYIGFGNDDGSIRGEGTFNISGGTATFARRVNIGRQGKGTINQTGGTVRVLHETFAIGDDGFNTSTAGGIGEYNMSGGTLDVTDELVIGNWTNTSGTLNVSGGAQVTSRNNMYVSNFGPAAWTGDTGGAWNQPDVRANGAINQTGGSIVNHHQFGIGRSSNGEGVYNLSSGSFETAKDLTDANNDGIPGDIAEGATFIGADSGHGEVNISGTGSFTAHDRVSIGQGFNSHETASAIATRSTGEVNLTGGTFQITDTAQPGAEMLLVVGFGGGDGQFNLSAGTATIQGDVHVAEETTYSLLRGGVATDVTTNFTTGAVNQTGGTMNIEGNLTLGVGIGSEGEYNLSGGVLDLHGGAIAIGTGSGAFNFTGGTLKDVGSASLNLVNAGGTIQIGASPGIMNVGGNFLVTSASGSLEIEIAAANSFDQLKVSGTAALGGKLDVSLIGGGVVLGDTNGDQTVDLVDLNNVRNNFGATGLGDTDGDSDVDLTDLNNVRNNFGTSGEGFVPAVGSTFDILTATGGRTGAFASTDLPGLPGGSIWEVRYLANGVQLAVVASAVPEPGAAAYVVIAAVVLAAGWRRRMR